MKLKTFLSLTLCLVFQILLFAQSYPDLVPDEKNGKWGVINYKTKEVIVPHRYDKVCDYYFDRAFIFIDRKSGVIDEKGKLILPAEFYGISPYHIPSVPEDNFILANKNGKTQVFDWDGKEIQVDAKFDQAKFIKLQKDEITCMRLTIKQPNGTYKFKLVDYKFNNVFPQEFDYFEKHVDGDYLVMVDEKFGIIHPDLTFDYPIDPLKYVQKIDGYKDGLQLVKIGNRFGAFNDKEELIIPIIYPNRFNFDENGFTSVFLNGKVGMIDRNNKTILPFEYDQITSNYYNGKEDSNLYRTVKDSLIGFWDVHGKKNIPNKYEAIKNISIDSSFYDEKLTGEFFKLTWQARRQKESIVKMFLIKEKGLWGIVDEKFNSIISPKYEELNFSDFSDSNYNNTGYLKAKSNGKYGLVSFLGSEIIPFKYDAIEYFHDYYFKVKNNDKWALLALNQKNEKLEYADSLSTLFINSLNDYPDNYDRTNQGLRNKGSNSYSRNWLIYEDGRKKGIKSFFGKIILPAEDYDELQILRFYHTEIDSTKKVDSGFGSGFKTFAKRKIEIDFILAKKGNKVGLLNPEFQTIIPIDYDEIQMHSKTLFRVTKNHKIGLINLKGEIVLPIENDRVEGNWVVKNNLEGFVSTKTGALILEIEFNKIEHENLYLKTLKNEKWGIADPRTGRIILPCEYFHIERKSYHHRNYEVIKDNKKGLIDTSGVIILPFEYEGFQQINEQRFNHLVAIKKDSRWGMVNSKTKEIIIPIDYEEIYFKRKTDWIIVKKDSKFGVVNIDHQILVPPIYDKIERNYITKNGKVGLVNKSGEVQVPPIYDFLQAFDNHFFDGFGFLADSEQEYLYKVKKGNLVGIINQDNKVIVPSKYDDVRDIGRSAFSLIKNGKKGYLSKDGKYFVQAKYDEVKRRDTYFIVKDGPYKYVLDSIGNELLKGEYFDLEYIKGRYFKFKKGGKWGLINLENELILNEEYDDIFSARTEHLAIKKEGKIGMMDKNFKLIIPCIFDELKLPFHLEGKDGNLTYNYFSEGLVVGKINNKWGYMDKKGNWIIEPKYQRASYFHEGKAIVVLGFKEIKIDNPLK